MYGAEGISLSVCRKSEEQGGGADSISQPDGLESQPMLDDLIIPLLNLKQCVMGTNPMLQH